MASESLSGHSILVVEDEPLIAVDIKLALEHAGARVITARTKDEALDAIDGQQRLSAVVLDHLLGEQDSGVLCERLNALAIPFVNYSALSPRDEHCADAPHISKPTPARVIVHKIATLLH